MDLEKIFKNLLIAQGILLVILIIAELNMPSEYYEINEMIQSDFSLSEIFMFLSLIFLIAIFVSLILLYRYVSFGKNFYVIVFIVGTVLQLLAGAYVLHAFTLTIITIHAVLTGATLTLLFFSPIKNKFIKE